MNPLVIFSQAIISTVIICVFEWEYKLYLLVNKHMHMYITLMYIHVCIYTYTLRNHHRIYFIDIKYHVMDAISYKCFTFISSFFVLYSKAILVVNRMLCHIMFLNVARK